MTWNEGWRERAIRQITFNCARCGKCCSKSKIIDLFPEDLNRLTRKFHTGLGSVVKSFCEPHIAGGRRFMMKGVSPCRFFDNKCKIYCYRPIVCRMTPFLAGKKIYCDVDFGELVSMDEGVILDNLVASVGLSKTEVLRYLKYIGAYE